MRTISQSECNSFEEVRKLFERAFGEIDDINLIIAPEKIKRLKQIAADKALIEKKAKEDAAVRVAAETKAKEIAEAQTIIDNAAAIKKNRARREAETAEALKKAKKVIADSEKGGN